MCGGWGWGCFSFQVIFLSVVKFRAICFVVALHYSDEYSLWYFPTFGSALFSVCARVVSSRYCVRCQSHRVALNFSCTVILLIPGFNYLTDMCSRLYYVYVLLVSVSLIRCFEVWCLLTVTRLSAHLCTFLLVCLFVVKHFRLLSLLLLLCLTSFFFVFSSTVSL